MTEHLSSPDRAHVTGGPVAVGGPTDERCPHGTTRLAPARDFLGRLAARDVTVGVIGLGYTGLPLALASAQAGFRTIGHDIDAELCARLNRGISHIGDVGDAPLQAMRAAGRFTAVSEGLRPIPEVVFLCVPTPFDQAPDLSYVRAAARTVAGVLRPGMLVIAQSTSYPGTTTEVIQPILEHSGLAAGRDFALAFSPERIDPGNTIWTIRTTPRLVGGVTGRCSRLASAALGAILGDPGLVRPVRSPAVAEFAKLLENSYRLVNIGLVNELTIVAHEMGIGIAEVIEAAATKPYGFQAFYPGVGPGGACVPEDPLYLAWKAGTLGVHTPLIHVAAVANEGMARYVYTRILEMLAKRGRGLAGLRVLCVGAGYKPGVADTRHSRALYVMRLLAGAGAVVDYADPLIPAVEIAGREYKSVALEAASAADYGLVAVLVSGHGLDLDRFLAAGVPVLDAAHALTGTGAGLAERL
jgi:UDP-N-acetyl-D-glucosamine dehydrogenase